MILTGKEDLRIQRTIEAIQHSFCELICEKDYEQISVKELCERARINKKTFYTYYTALDDLLAELQNTMSSEYVERISSFKLPEEVDKVIREFYLYSEEKGPVYERITCSGNFQYIRQRMINHVMQSTWYQVPQLQECDQYTRNIFMTYMQVTSVDLYKQWVADGKKIPLEEIIRITTQLVCGGVFAFMTNGIPL